MPDQFINPKVHGRFTMLPDWLMARSELSVGAKLVYARLCRWYDEEKRSAYPSLEKIAGWQGVGIRQVRTYLRELEDARLIKVKRVGLGQTNQYAFLAHPWRDEQTGPPVDLPPPDLLSFTASDRQETADPAVEMIRSDRQHTSGLIGTKLPIQGGSDDPLRGGSSLPTKILGLRDQIQETDRALGDPAVLLDQPTDYSSSAAAAAATKQAVRSLDDRWRGAFGRPLNPAQRRKLLALDEAAAMAGLPDLLDACITYTAERGKDAGYLFSTVEGCITERRLPGRPAAGQNDRTNRPAAAGRHPTPFHDKRARQRITDTLTFEEAWADNARNLAAIGWTPEQLAELRAQTLAAERGTAVAG